MRFLQILLSCLLLCAIPVIGLGENVATYPPAPGHGRLPVVFWSHFMPQVGTAQLDANGHAQGGTDCFPFITRGNSVAEYVQHIRYALASGINGFQMLTFPDPQMYEAARRVYAETSQMFYVAPQWCDQGSDIEKAAKQIGDFAVAHKDDPHVFRIDGKQVHFFYGVSWAKSDTDENINKVKELIKARGAEVLFLPADGHNGVMSADKILLDRPELGHAPWPSFAAPTTGTMKYFNETKWDGCDSWGPCETSNTMAQVLLDRLRPYGDRYVYLPSVWPGYDSSNRAWQAIHCPARGIGVLHDNLRRWVELGIRQLDFVTWNDVNETMLLPSTRSPFGFAEVINYYHTLAETGESPYEMPRVVVSYDPETLFGDELFFQFLILPERKAYASDYLCQVKFEDDAGALVASLTTRGTVSDARHDVLTEARLDTTALAGKAEVLSPVVSVYRVDPTTNNRQVVYANLRLAPITLRYNKIQFYTPYAIALSHVAPDCTLTLSSGSPSSRINATTGTLLPVAVTSSSSEPLRRISLAESRLTRGAFRADDTRATIGTGQVRAFLRIRCEKDLTYRINIAGGNISERYYDHWDTARVLAKINADSFVNSITTAVFRLTAMPNAAITITPQGVTTPAVTTSMAALAPGPLTASVTDASGARMAIRLELTLDAAELNVDYPLPQAGDYLRFVPVDRNDDATRYFHAWALTASDKIAYSRPLVVCRVPAPSKSVVVNKPDTMIPCQFIRSGGIFDDFVNSSSSTAQNPFSATDVITATLPARQIPYYLLDMDEGTGTRLNDGGTAHQVGRAWISGNCRWIADGWRGSALQLNGGQIQMRAKSFPHGAYTVSMRLKVVEPATAPTPLAADGDYWQGITMEGLKINLLPDGRVTARRQIGDSTGEATSRIPLQQGWNHLVVTHDLRTLRIYLNGALAAEAPISKPAYQRTHSTPSFGFSQVDKAKLGATAPTFTGDIDQLEIIGTCLDGISVQQLYRAGQWCAR